MYLTYAQYNAVLAASTATTGTCAERMNALSRKFPNVVPADLAEVLHGIHLITEAEYRNIVDNGFEFDIGSEAGRVTYRGYTIVQLTLGSWVVAAIPGKPFATYDAAKAAIDARETVRQQMTETRLPHGDSL